MSATSGHILNSCRFGAARCRWQRDAGAGVSVAHRLHAGARAFQEHAVRYWPIGCWRCTGRRSVRRHPCRCPSQSRPAGQLLSLRPDDHDEARPGRAISPGSPRGCTSGAIMASGYSIFGLPCAVCARTWILAGQVRGGIRRPGCSRNISGVTSRRYTMRRCRSRIAVSAMAFSPSGPPAALRP